MMNKLIAEERLSTTVRLKQVRAEGLTYKTILGHKHDSGQFRTAASKLQLAVGRQW